MEATVTKNSNLGEKDLQENLPLTTIYPEMVAEIYSHFENENLLDFGKKIL